MSYNEFHKGKLHKLTRGMSETENKVKELAKQYDVPFDEDEDLNSNCWDIYQKSGVRYIVINKDFASFTYPSTATARFKSSSQSE